MSNRRVVVTGLGIVSPVGNNLKQSWDNITAGKSGVIAIDKFDTTGFSAKIAATVKDFDASPVLPAKELKKMDEFAIPILILSADKEEKSQAEGIALGASYYLTKPFKPNEVVARIEDIFKEREETK